MKKYDVIIIGAGTSGLTARREVIKKTNNYLVIDDGPLGTTCARVGCMPSKVLIQAANDFHRRHTFKQSGIQGGESLSLDTKKVMEHVRSLRDRFVRSVKGGMESWEKDHLLRGRAKFIDKKIIEVNGEKLEAEKFILAVGSRPLFLNEWEPFKNNIVTTDEIFEMENLPKSLLVIGLGVIGVELGQAMSRLGVKVYGATYGKGLGGLTDPDLKEYASKTLEKDFKIYYNGASLLKTLPNGEVEVEASNEKFNVEKILIAVGRKSNVDKLDIEKIGISLDKKGLPEFDINTLKLKEAPYITIPGDVNADRSVLHEAADEGYIAGQNTINDEETCFKRRERLGIVFTDPNIAIVGKRYSDLKDEKADFVYGEVSFEGQGRSIVKLKEKGHLKVYFDKNTAKFLGSEMIAPSGEHLAHLLSWSLSMKLSVYEMLKMPFYHPVIEEGLRTALRDAATKIDADKPELYRCGDTPIR